MTLRARLLGSVCSFTGPAFAVILRASFSLDETRKIVDRARTEGLVK